MASTSKNALLAVLFAAIVCCAAFAYDHPLDSNAIRDAYFLGTDNHRSVEFLSTYLMKLPVPHSGPYVSEIAVRTPFAQVVQNSRDHSVGYSAQQAQDDYRKNPNTVQVRIQILLFSPFATTNIGQPSVACQGVQRMNSALDCFRGFRFRFRQGNQASGKSIQAQQTYGVPIYNADGPFYGGDVWFTFRASQIASAPLHVSVTRPDGQTFAADFDLAALR